MNQCHLSDVYDDIVMNMPCKTIGIRMCGTYTWSAHSWGFRVSDHAGDISTQAAARLYLRHTVDHHPQCSYYRAIAEKA